jgi:hypothetical protein
MLYAASGMRTEALRWLRDAFDRTGRVADPYVWIRAHCLDALAAAAIAADAPDAPDLVAELEQLAARGDMREMVVRAALHRARLGDASGVPSARLLAEAIDSRALQAAVAAAI